MLLTFNRNWPILGVRWGTPNVPVPGVANSIAICTTSTRFVPISPSAPPVGWVVFGLRGGGRIAMIAFSVPRTVARDVVCIVH